MKKLLLSVFLSFAIAAGQPFAQQEKENQGKEKETPKKEVKKNEVKGSNHEKGKVQNKPKVAKNKKEAVGNAHKNISKTKTLNVSTRGKIKQARAKLEEKKKDKKITEADYQKKKKSLDGLEKELNALDAKVTTTEKQLDSEK